jgi:acyl-CoA hydrolase
MTNEASDPRQLVETRMVYPIFPANANHYNTLFGGQAMAWMDQAAFICATRWCRSKVVTAHSSEIDFHHSMPVGTIVEVIARLIKVGRTSMNVHVEMWLEPMDRLERKLACQGEFVLVAIDDDNRPKPVPPLITEPAST